MRFSIFLKILVLTTSLSFVAGMFSAAKVFGASLDRKIICSEGIHDVFEFPVPKVAESLEGKAEFFFEKQAMNMRCALVLEFTPGPVQVDQSTKEWSCVDRRYLADSSFYAKGFYYVELYSSGIADVTTAVVSFVKYGQAKALKELGCRVQVL